MAEEENLILALKTLQKDKISFSDFDNFKKEFIPWIKLSNHPYIVEAFTVDLDDNQRPYLIIEPISPDEFGRHTLEDFMGKDLSEEQILEWCIQFCYAMDYINKQGYIHGDIKPSNILISNNVIKITDFGLVSLIKDDIKHYIASIPYLALESFTGTKNVLSELYSFGMVMYQLINFGKLPFDGLTDYEWENFHKNGEIPKLESDVYPFISKCLDKNLKRDIYLLMN